MGVNVEDTAFVTCPEVALKTLKPGIPAYGRYWSFIGLAGPTRDGETTVQVYGYQQAGFERPVGMRKEKAK